MKRKRLKMPGIRSATERSALPMMQMRDDLSFHGTRWQKWLAYKKYRTEVCWPHNPLKISRLEARL